MSNALVGAAEGGAGQGMAPKGQRHIGAAEGGANKLVYGFLPVHQFKTLNRHYLDFLGGDSWVDNASFYWRGRPEPKLGNFSY